eukprot:GFYU01009834.1.p1 GENE.GFYU01009834.1~~GFYU01009834.1.p1  ORF type:complete len:427 (-),score=91.72 GFYU01009834.1:843-2123(-)
MDDQDEQRMSFCPRKIFDEGYPGNPKPYYVKLTREGDDLHFLITSGRTCLTGLATKAQVKEMAAKRSGKSVNSFYNHIEKAFSLHDDNGKYAFTFDPSDVHKAPQVKMIFSFRTQVGGEATLLELGHIPVQITEEKPHVGIKSFLDSCIDSIADAQKAYAKLSEEKDLTTKNLLEANQSLNDARAAKQELELKYVSKFVSLINTKKRRIVELEAELTRTREQLDEALQAQAQPEEQEQENTKTKAKGKGKVKATKESTTGKSGGKRKAPVTDGAESDGEVSEKMPPPSNKKKQKVNDNSHAATPGDEPRGSGGSHRDSARRSLPMASLSFEPTGSIFAVSPPPSQEGGSNKDGDNAINTLDLLNDSPIPAPRPRRRPRRQEVNLSFDSSQSQDAVTPLTRRRSSRSSQRRQPTDVDDDPEELLKHA